MTEQEWLTADSPHELIRHVRAVVSRRKLRLFACACCRPLLGEVKEAPTAEKLAAAERFADGLITDEQFRSFFVYRRDLNERSDRFREAVWFAFEALGWPDAEQPNWDLDAETYEAVERPWEPGGYAAHFTDRVCIHAVNARTLLALGYRKNRDPGDRFPAARRPISAQCADTFRDIFGNPFRPVTFSPECRTDTAVSLARQMYDSREFSAAPILADALQDAGCDNEDILAHLRDGTLVHVRGCWVVDLVLGKQ